MVRTSDACNVDNFFRSSEPRLAIARVVSVRSCLESEVRNGGREERGEKGTDRDFLSVAESLAVPSWSTSLRMPWTLAFILKTCREREDWREVKGASWGLATVDGAREGWVRPASMS